MSKKSFRCSCTQKYIVCKKRGKEKKWGVRAAAQSPGREHGQLWGGRAEEREGRAPGRAGARGGGEPRGVVPDREKGEEERSGEFTKKNTEGEAGSRRERPGAGGGKDAASPAGGRRRRAFEVWPPALPPAEEETVRRTKATENSPMVVTEATLRNSYIC